MFNHLDYQMMAKALKLAKKARFSSHPNPCVGCVITKDERIIAQGWTQAAGEAHAEIHAMSCAQTSLAGATAYVTLEPCSHFGRTPPCTDALIEAGILRIVVSVQDPSVKVAGKGIARLKEAGIKVEMGLFEAQARELNKGFFSVHERDRPWVRSKIAVSLDGKTAMSSGESKWITGPFARQDGHKFRAQAGAILTGINTILNDDPSLTVRLSQQITDGPSRQPLRVILDSSLKTPLDAKVFEQSTPVLIATCVDTQSIKAKALQRKGISLLQMPQNNTRVDLKYLLQTLAAMQVNEIHLEAGNTLNGQFLQQGLLDEIVIYTAPKILGDSGQGMFDLSLIKRLDQSLDMIIMDQRMVGDDLRLIIRNAEKK